VLKVNLSMLAFTLVIMLAVGLYCWKITQTIAQPLPAVEIQEYGGENFSIVNDLRENSIKRTKGINLAKYLLVVDGLIAKPAHCSFK
jgi:hypothetical protein